MEEGSEGSEEGEKSEEEELTEARGEGKKFAKVVHSLLQFSLCFLALLKNLAVAHCTRCAGELHCVCVRTFDSSRSDKHEPSGYVCGCDWSCVPARGCDLYHVPFLLSVACSQVVPRADSVVLSQKARLQPRNHDDIDIRMHTWKASPSGPLLLSRTCGGLHLQESTRKHPSHCQVINATVSIFVAVLLFEACVISWSRVQNLGDESLSWPADRGWLECRI